MILDKQHLLLQYLISSPDTFLLCKGIIETDYFDPKLRSTVSFITEYYDSYSALPTPEQIKAETSYAIAKTSITRDQMDYCCKEIETFCRQQAMLAVIYESPALIKAEKYGVLETRMKEALMISLSRDIGLDYFESPQDRLETLLDQPGRYPTMWFAFDELLGGGLAETELLLLTGSSGGGKSIAMANLALNYVKQQQDVMYISLELSEELIAQRFDTMVSGIPTFTWRSHWETIAGAVQKLGREVGRLTITRMPVGTNARQIRALLKEYELVHKTVPKVLVVDYLDLLGTNEAVSADNISQKDKLASEQLRDIVEDYRMIGITASQQNRAAIDADTPSQAHIAGGITKINTVDWTAAIVLTESMRAAGEINFVFTKVRSSDGLGKAATLKWDPKRLTITNLTSVSTDKYLESHERMSNKKPQQRGSLGDAMIDL